MVDLLVYAKSVDEHMYPNLVRVFYSNINLSTSRENKKITNVYRIPIEFDVSNLNTTLGTRDNGLVLFISRKELKYTHRCY